MNWDQLLLLAVGIAISPIPIAAIILTMMSQRGIANGLGFLAGWLIALILITAGGALLFQTINTPEKSAAISGGPSITRIVFGIILLGLAIRFGWQYAKRNRDQPRVPGWLKTIDQFGPLKSGALGFVLTIANIKNLPLAIEAAGLLSSLKDNAAPLIQGTILFILIATIGVATPVAATYWGKQTAEKLLQRWKVWLQHHNAIILCVLFSILGLRAIIQGSSFL